MLVIFLLVLLIGQAFSDSSVCSLKCNPKQSYDTDAICLISNCPAPIGINCCLENGVIRIDLRNCGLHELVANTFLLDEILLNQTNLIEVLCLDQNDVGPGNLSADALRGLTGLKTIVVPSLFTGECPGGNKFWNTANRTKSALECINQRMPCNVSGEVCPDKSHCVDDGPGLMRCNCNDGYYGYKCLKSGKFPYATFYGSLGAATVVTSAVLWFVGRRKIGLHTKQS